MPWEVYFSLTAIATLPRYERLFGLFFLKRFFEQIFTAPLENSMPVKTGGDQPPGQGGVLWGAGAGLVVK